MLTLVKWGGSLITDKGRPRTARPDRIARLCEVLADQRRVGSLLLGHGSGSFGHVEAAAFGTAHGARTPQEVEGASRTWMRARELHQIVLGELSEAGLSPMGFSPSAFLQTRGGQCAEASAGPLRAALALGLLPVVHGDVVLDGEQGVAICSTEEVFLALQPLLGIEASQMRVLWLGVTDGILDGRGQTIEVVDQAAHDALRQGPLEAEHTDVTGGMALRLKAAWELAGRGVESWILNGTRSEEFAAALQGEKLKRASWVPPR